MSESPIELPSAVAIARRLCELVGSLPEDFNRERVCLENVRAALDEEPPNIASARLELQRGLAHAFRGTFKEDDRPESWLVAACARLLHDE